MAKVGLKLGFTFRVGPLDTNQYARIDCEVHDIDTDMDIPTQLEGTELALGQMWAHVRDEVDKNSDEVLNEGSSK